MKKERGITLIALVVTIIVLLILAGVTIATLTGPNGILTRAQEAKRKTEEAAEDEQEALNNESDYIDEILGGETSTTVAKAKGGIKYNNTTPVTDDSGETLYVPGGFKITQDSATDIDDGIVITDGTNEFVWIPVSNADLNEMYTKVENPIKLSEVETTTDIYSKLKTENSETYIADIPGSINVREPDVLKFYDTYSQYYKDILKYNTVKEMADEFVVEYKTIYESIKKYGGFYVGRYELTGSLETPTTQKEKKILTAEIAGNWYQLKKACSNVVDTKYAKSEMIYGNQWDKVMDWLVDTQNKTYEQIYINSSEWGNFNDSIGNAAINSGILQVSGKNEYWKANNIYDLAGNYYELTQEAYGTTRRISRGGNADNSGSVQMASCRINNPPDYAGSSTSSRAILYIRQYT